MNAISVRLDDREYTYSGDIFEVHVMAASDRPIKTNGFSAGWQETWLQMGI